MHKSKINILIFLLFNYNYSSTLAMAKYAFYNGRMHNFTHGRDTVKELR